MLVKKFQKTNSIIKANICSLFHAEKYRVKHQYLMNGGNLIFYTKCPWRLQVTPLLYIFEWKIYIQAKNIFQEDRQHIANVFK